MMPSLARSELCTDGKGFGSQALRDIDPATGKHKRASTQRRPIPR